MTRHRCLALALLVLVGLLVLPSAALAAQPARSADAVTPAGFDRPPEWRSICDSVGRKGTPYVRGTNCRYLKLDGVYRRWVVDIPRSGAFPMGRAWPVVMVIHGSSASGERMREKTNWPAVLEREGVIGIYPTAWRYKRLLNGLKVTRWATYGLSKEIDLAQRLDGYPRGAPFPTRDVEFLRRVMSDVRAHLRLDERHIHAAGSSQGGRFITRMSVEMADTFASMSCMGWCDAPPAGVSGPRPMSTLYTIGQLDELMRKEINSRRSPDISAIPITWPAAWSVLKPYLVPLLRAWDLPTKPAKVSAGATGLSVLWRARRGDPGWTMRFRLMVLKGVEHQPPTSGSNPLGIDLAEIAWPFFLDNPKP